MKKIKLTPINLTQALSAKAVSVNLTLVLDAQIEIANQINGAVLEFNSAVNSINDKSETNLIKEEIKTILDKIGKLEPSILEKLSNDKNEALLKKIKGLIPESFDPSSMEKEIKELRESLKNKSDKTEESKGSTEKLLKELELNKQDLKIYKESSQEKEKVLNKTLALLQSELRSARKTLGLNISEVRSKIDKITEVK